MAEYTIRIRRTEYSATKNTSRELSRRSPERITQDKTSAPEGQAGYVGVDLAGNLPQSGQTAGTPGDASGGTGPDTDLGTGTAALPTLPGAAGTGGASRVVVTGDGVPNWVHAVAR